MKNLFFIMSILTAGIISCSSCAKTDTVSVCDASAGCGSSTPVVSSATPATTGSSLIFNPVVPFPIPTSQVIKGNGWQVTIPDGWESKSEEVNSTIRGVYLNGDKRNVVVIMQESFTGSVSDYVLEAMKGLKDSGATMSTATQVSLNGSTFFLIDSTKKDSSNNTVNMWMWVGVVKGNGYAVSCGGPASVNGEQEMCNNIVNTFKVQ